MNRAREFKPLEVRTRRGDGTVPTSEMRVPPQGGER